MATTGGTFRQPMDLSAFPLDDQYLNLQITLHCRARTIASQP